MKGVEFPGVGEWEKYCNTRRKFKFKGDDEEVEFMEEYIDDGV